MAHLSVLKVAGEDRRKKVSKAQCTFYHSSPDPATGILEKLAWY